MPDLTTVKAACDTVAKTMWQDCSARDLDLVARDMAQHPKDYGAWQGPNWDEPFLRAELAQRLWNLPDHPDRIPARYRGLPFRTLRDVLAGVTTVGGGWQIESAAEREEWLAQIACNRRFSGTEWREWLDNPERWRLRHIEQSAFDRIQQWATE